MWWDVPIHQAPECLSDVCKHLRLVSHLVPDSFTELLYISAGQSVAMLYLITERRIFSVALIYIAAVVNAVSVYIKTDAWIPFQQLGGCSQPKPQQSPVNLFESALRQTKNLFFSLPVNASKLNH